MNFIIFLYKEFLYLSIMVYDLTCKLDLNWHIYFYNSIDLDYKWNFSRSLNYSHLLNINWDLPFNFDQYLLFDKNFCEVLNFLSNNLISKELNRILLSLDNYNVISFNLNWNLDLSHNLSNTWDLLFEHLCNLYSFDDIIRNFD